jgi:hypothetical protein
MPVPCRSKSPSAIAEGNWNNLMWVGYVSRHQLGLDVSRAMARITKTRHRRIEKTIKFRVIIITQNSAW